MKRNEIDSKEKQIQVLRAAANRIRRHSLEITDEAGSGHPTSSLSCAEILSVLFFAQMKLDRESPRNRHNDRFVLSKGHAAPALWSVYYEGGLIDRSALHSLREIDSPQEGHPTPRHDWVDVATGSLGQGLPMALGMAWAARHYDTDSRTYVLLGDGETAEGSVWEAASLASHEGLGTLTAIVDVNEFGQSEGTMLKDNLEAYQSRFASFGWESIQVDGHDVNALIEAFETARRSDDKPTVILAKTEKGKGVPEIEGEKGSHGKPAPSLENALDALDEDAKDHSRERELEIQPTERTKDFPSIVINGGIGRGNYETGEEVATRAAFGRAMLDLGQACDQLVALDGDVKNSTKLEEFFDKYPDRSIECYIAEQNMIGTAIGLGKSGILPCAASFAAFLTRAYDQLRMAGISRSRLILAGSHAGVAIGQDGPTQMGLEDLAMARSIPGSLVLYPSDAVSTHAAVELAAHHDGISYIRLNRGKTPGIYREDERFEPGGSKVWKESEEDRATLIGAGISLFQCMEAQKTLEEEGIRVRVLDCYAVKPVDRKNLLRCAEETGAMIVVEDHYREGGIGEAVFTALRGVPLSSEHLAIEKVSRSGSPDALLDFHGISSSHICDAVRNAIH